MDRRARGLRVAAAGTVGRAAAAAGIASMAAWEGVQGRQSVASHASILAVVGGTLALAAVAGRRRQRCRTGDWARGLLRSRGTAPVAGSVLWAVLVVVTVGWDLASFLAQRRWLPTLSRLIGAVTDHPAGRGALFACWIALGLYLALGWRRPRAEGGP